MKKYVVIGNFRQPHKDCEGESQECETYMEALQVRAEWEKEQKYKEVFISKLRI